MQKLTKAQLREACPAEVVEFVEAWQKQQRTRHATIADMTGRQLYFAEDMRYTAFRNGKSASVRCGGEWGGYRKGDPIGKSVDVPVGTWVIETGYFLGKPTCHVMNWGDAAGRLPGKAQR